MKNDIEHAELKCEKQPQELVPHLRFLKFLVGSLAMTMVLGLTTIVVILWTRLGTPPLPELPASVTLPEGTRPQAVTFARERLIIVTDTGKILIYDAAGNLDQEVPLNQP